MVERSKPRSRLSDAERIARKQSSMDRLKTVLGPSGDTAGTIEIRPVPGKDEAPGGSDSDKSGQ